MTMIGTHQRRVDARGYIVVPASWRDQGDKCYMVAKVPGLALGVWPERQWEALFVTVKADQARSLRLPDEALRHMLASSVVSQIDTRGRIHIPLRLWQYAEVETGTDCLVVGMVTRFELWSHQNWNANADCLDQVFTPSKQIHAAA